MFILTFTYFLERKRNEKRTKKFLQLLPLTRKDVDKFYQRSEIVHREWRETRVCINYLIYSNYRFTLLLQFYFLFFSCRLRKINQL